MPMSTDPSGAPALAGGTATTLRQRNSSAVLDIVRRASTPLRVAEIAQAASLSRPTVETVAEGLLDQDWLLLADADDAGAPSVGRPARLYRFNERAGFVLGVDVGAHSVTVAIGDLRGGIVATERHRVAPELPAIERLAATSDVIAALIAHTGIARSDILAMTVGTPGTVSPATDRVGLSPGMPGWPEVDVVGALAASVDCAIELENDANLAAVGERARGIGAGCADMVFLLLGERLGAGIIANDALVRGRNGAAGELGYVPVRGARDRDPRFGPLESRVNASALVRMGLRAAAEHPDSALAASAELSAGDVTLAATRGDAYASGLVRRLARRIAHGIAPTLLTLNPELLVVGGGVSLAGEVLRSALASAITKVVLYPPEVRLSALGDEAVVLGAVTQSLERVEADVLARVSA
ncbi:MAG: ROK family protein [Pseudolysinimonas sp.]